MRRSYLLGMLQVNGGHHYQIIDNGTKFLENTEYFELLTMKSSIVLYVEDKESNHRLASLPDKNVFSYPQFEVNE